MGRLERLASGMLEVCWLATVVLTPLFIDRNGSDVFEGAKAGLLRALALMMLASWAMRALASPAREAGAPRWRAALAWLRVPVIAAALGVLVVHGISTLLSLNPAESYWGHPGRALGLLTLLAYGAICAATIANLRTREQLRRLITALIVPSIPIVGYALVQRLRFEPLHIAMRETDVQRVTSLLGQPVFLAGYLAMVLPFTAMRLRALYVEPARPGARRRLAIGVHAFVLLLQVVGILLTESRGPLLGAFVGIGLAALVIAARHDHRRLLIGVLVCGAVGLGTVLGVAPSLRTSSNPEVQRIATRVSDVFAVAGGGGQFRTTTWNVATRVLANPAPLELADGSHDPHHGLRWLIGYGPEMQYVVSPPFYDEELPRLFGYFLADRFHNGLWDALVVAGVLGLAAMIALQSALLWTVLEKLGLLATQRERRWFWAAYGGGAASGALGWIAVHGLAFVFLGLQLGALGGVALLLAVRGTRRIGSPAQAERPAFDQAPVLLAILVAVVSHLVEVSFSFAVVTTGAVFWLLCALVAVLPRLAQEEPTPALARAAAGVQVDADADPEAWRDAIVSGALLALVTMTLGFVFLGGVRLAPKPTDLLWDGLMLLAEPRGRRAPVVAILVGASVVLAALVFATAPRGEGRAPHFGRRLRWTLGIGAVVGAAYWMRLSTLLSKRGVLSTIPGKRAIDNIVLRAEAVQSFYVWAGLILGLVALYLATSVAPAASRPLRWWRAAASAACVVAALALLQPFVFRPAEAEAATALGHALNDQQKMVFAEEAYAHAAALRPHASVPAASLAKTYRRHARIDKAHEAALFQLANQAMLDAIARNPADSENATNLALIRSNWAQHVGSRELTAAVPGLFAHALRLNPMDPRIWQAWAKVQLHLLHDSTGALESAQRALSLEPGSRETATLLGTIQTAIASRASAADRSHGIDGAPR